MYYFFFTSEFRQGQTSHVTSSWISDTPSTDTSKTWAWGARTHTHSAAGQADPISRGTDTESTRGLSCRRQSRQAPRRLWSEAPVRSRGDKTTPALHLVISEPQKTWQDRQPSEHSLIYTNKYVWIVIHMRAYGHTAAECKCVQVRHRYKAVKIPQTYISRLFSI